MNRYGRQAMAHWQESSPTEVAAMTDAEAYFTQLGEDMAQAVEDLAQKLAGTPPAGETFLQRVRRLTMARTEAEDQVVRGMVVRGMLTTP